MDSANKEDKVAPITFNPNPTLIEQVFSNDLLVELILEHSETQDLLRASLVSRSWFAKSRKILKSSKKNKHGLCIKIDSDSPCRTLLKFKAFLEEQQNSKNNDYPLIYNGIKFLSQTSECHRCLRSEWLGNDRRRLYFWDSAQEHVVMREMQQFFGPNLEKLNFRHIRLYGNLTYYCPFTCFIKNIIKTKRENIVELDFGSVHSVSSNLTQILLIQDRGDPINFLEFPNLETIGIMGLYTHSTQNRVNNRLPILAPSLKKIKRFPYKGASCRALLPDFQRYAITCLQDFTKGIKGAIAFVQEFQPKIEVLEDRETDDPQIIFLREDIFQLGKLVSATLTSLSCSTPILTFLTFGCESSGNQADGIRNQFPALKTLELNCSDDMDTLNWFNYIDFSKDFRNLQVVKLTFIQEQFPLDFGLESLQTPCRFQNVKYLHLRKNWGYRNFIVDAGPWLNIFSQINHLNLIGMPIDFNYDNSELENLLIEIVKLQFLKDLTIRSDNLTNFSLNHLFTANNPDIDAAPCTGTNQLQDWKPTILYHKSLRNIHIHGEKICKPSSQNICRSYQSLGTFLVSAGIARDICKHLPGFRFWLNINGRCIPECSNESRPGGFLLEHLDPYTKIQNEQAAGEMFSRRLWEIEFLDLTSTNIGAAASVSSISSV